MAKESPEEIIERLHDEIAELSDVCERYYTALREIADQDWRGGMPYAVRIARSALLTGLYRAENLYPI